MNEFVILFHASLAACCALDIILIIRRNRAFAESCQLTAVDPGKIHPVPILQRIPDGIVGDRLTIVGSHQIFPGAVAVSIAHRLGRRPQRPRGVSILLPLQQIPPDIVAVGGTLVRLLAVHPHQLVQAVIAKISALPQY